MNVRERFVLSKCDRCGKATNKQNHGDANGLYVLPPEWGEPLAEMGAFCAACCELPKENWLAWYAAQQGVQLTAAGVESDGEKSDSGGN